MKNRTLMKFAQFALIVLVCLAADQWTKHLAETRLASYRPGHWEHPVVLEVPEEFDGKTVREFVTHEFEDWNSPEEIDRILMSVTDDRPVMLSPGQTLETGDVVEVRHREVVIIPDHFDFQYTRNEGAAFSFLADHDSPWRLPFFVIVNVFAVLLILWILRGVGLQQQLLVWGLSLIAGGALGNLIDRIRLEYVIDFIVLKWTDAYRWPTFNIADSAIVLGVSLLVLEMIVDGLRGSPEEDEQPAETTG
jgi:lipoprotein signal peptidase